MPKAFDTCRQAFRPQVLRIVERQNVQNVNGAEEFAPSVGRLNAAYLPGPSTLHIPAPKENT